MTFELIDENRCFGGVHRRYRHASATLNCDMGFAVYLPPQALALERVPALYWLSGLTCTDENFMQKAGAQRVAAELGLALIAPDTSPRGAHVPSDPDGGFEFGHGAGYYIDASEAPWSANYRMHDYVVRELPELLEAALPLSGVRSIAGHSMGGHGAMVIALRHPGRYRSVSAFAPICHPSASPRGRKALTLMLGQDERKWRAWDTVLLLPHAVERLPILVDQGLRDASLESLRPDALEAAAQALGYPLTLRRHAGYDHGYYFVASFIEEHLRYHAQALKADI